MKETDEKFIQLYGKPADVIIKDERYKYAKHDFELGYKCGFDAAMELQAQEDDYQDEKLTEDILSRGG